MSWRVCGNAFLNEEVLGFEDLGLRRWTSRRQKLLLNLKSRDWRLLQLQLLLQKSLPLKNLHHQSLVLFIGVLLMFAIFAALDRFFLGGFVGRGGFIVSLLLTDFKFNASAFIVALSFSAVVGAS